jgi:CheY-like chemotaxis protein
MTREQDTVLFVDDEANILTALNRLLRREGYQILMAGSGAEGLELLDRQPVQLIVSDQRMPDMAGTEFLQRVKEKHPDTVRVILSGYSDVNVILDSVNKGEIYQFLTKPWKGEELKIAIKQCLDHYHLLEQNRILLAKVREQNETLQHLNAELEMMVQQRTCSLQLSQEILEKLPIPVMGINPDGLIMLTNQQGREMFRKSVAGTQETPAERLFPGDMHEWLKHVLSQTDSPDKQMFASRERALAAQYIPLKQGKAPRGGILILEEG